MIDGERIVEIWEKVGGRGMVSEQLSTAIENFVEVFKCEPKQQAKAQLKQMIDEHTVGSVSSIESYEVHIEALTKENEQLRARIERAEKELKEETALREQHEAILQATIDRLGGKTTRHNFLQRIEELIDREKAHFKHSENSSKPKKAEKK